MRHRDADRTPSSNGDRRRSTVLPRVGRTLKPSFTMATTDDIRKRDVDDLTMPKDSPQHEYIANNGGGSTLTVTHSWMLLL